MSVTSVNIARISNNLQTQSLLMSLQRNTLSVFLEQNRISSGNRFNAPSEDPVGAGKAIQLTEILERQDQILSNIRQADSFLAVTDSAVGEVNDLLTQAHDIASEMVNSTADDSQRIAMAELVKGIINQLVTVGNRTYQGMQLFGGQQTTEPPFTQSSGGVEYRGDMGTLTAHVDYAQNPAVNLTGDELFGMLSSRVSGYVDLDPAVTAETRLADVDGVAKIGVTKGMVRVTLDTPAKSFLVDLSKTDTVGDVVDYINAAAENAGLVVGPGGDIEAAINGARNGIDINIGAGSITVAEVGEGVTARDLGIAATAAPGVAGGDLNARVTTTTTVASLFGGAGANLGSILVQNGEVKVPVDLSSARTVGDVLNRINNCGLDVQAVINQAGTGIDVINRVSGIRMSIGEAGGTTADLLGIRSMHSTSTLASLNDGKGVGNVAGETDFRIITRDNSRVDVNIDGAKTLQDVLDKINAAAANAGVMLTASEATTGNGIVLNDATVGIQTFRVERLNASTAIDDLGLNKVADNGAGEIIGDDVGAIRTDSVFTALYELHDALTAVNPSHVQEAQITSAAETIRRFIDHANMVQGTVGSRSKAMNIRLQMTEDAVTSGRTLLSEVKDLDYTEAVTRFQQAQMALQGNLMTGPRLLQLSLMNFLST